MNIDLIALHESWSGIYRTCQGVKLKGLYWQKKINAFAFTRRSIKHKLWGNFYITGAGNVPDSRINTVRLGKKTHWLSRYEKVL